MSKELADLIEQCRTKLKKEFGDDYSFMILGRGTILASSNVLYGVVIATERLVKSNN